MNKQNLSKREKQILSDVYDIRDPETIIGGADSEERRQLQNIISLLREPEAVITRKETEQKLSTDEILRLEYDAMGKVETEGVDSLNSQERQYYRLYLWRHVYKKNAKGEASKPIYINVAELIILEYKMFVLNKEVYFYNADNGTYEKDSNGLKLREIIKQSLDREFREIKHIDNVYDLILGNAKLTITDSQINRRPKHYIHFLNGYYDYKRDEMFPHDARYNDINVIPHNYNPERYPGQYKIVVQGKGLTREMVNEPLFFDKWLEESIPDQEDRTMFLQYLGYVMTLDTSRQKFMMLCGSGGTGKSTLLNLTEEIIGKQNISNVSLQGLQERFTPGMLYLKQANVCADIPLTALADVDMIKKLTGEDTVAAERKYKDHFSFRSYARLFFSANDIPVNLSDKTNAFYRRMLILKMDHKPDQIDYDLGKKLREEIPNIITKIMEELYCSQGGIDESDNSKELVKLAHKNSDTVEAFVSDKCEAEEKARMDRSTLYDAYIRYCHYEDRKAVTRSNFYKALSSKGYHFRRNNSGNDVVGLKLTNVINYPGGQQTVS